MLRPRFVAVVTATHALGLTLAAQQTDDLARLRDEHERSRAAAVRMLDDVYRLTLRQLEKQRAEAADYEGAQHAKAKLDVLDKKPGAALVIAKPLTYTLPATRSQTRDGANTDGSRQYVDFKKVGGKAVWDILTIELGNYEVFLTYSVGLPVFNPDAVRDDSDPSAAVPGGVVSFSEVTGLAASSPEALEKRVTTTGHWDNFIRESLGRYECRRGSVTVRVEATAATAGGLMRLRQVELVRISGATPAGAEPTPNPGDALKELRQKHRETLSATTGAVRTKYAAEFDDLERQLNASGDRAGAAAVARARSNLLKDQGTEKAEGKQ